MRSRLVRTSIKVLFVFRAHCMSRELITVHTRYWSVRDVLHQTANGIACTTGDVCRSAARMRWMQRQPDNGAPLLTHGKTHTGTHVERGNMLTWGAFLNAPPCTQTSCLTCRLGWAAVRAGRLAYPPHSLSSAHHPRSSPLSPRNTHSTLQCVTNASRSPIRSRTPSPNLTPAPSRRSISAPRQSRSETACHRDACGCGAQADSAVCTITLRCGAT